jgi:hypothetical protein
MPGLQALNDLSESVECRKIKTIPIGRYMMTNEKGITGLFADLRAANDPSAMQMVMLGATLSGDELRNKFEDLLTEAEDAGDEEQYSHAADGFRTNAVLAWALRDARTIESLSAQALYYGTLTDLEGLLKNYATTWSILAHLLPEIKSSERARLQDFARFRRSFELGLRARKERNERISAAVSLLAPTFDHLGAVNMDAIEDKGLDVEGKIKPLWDDVSKLIEKIEKA